MKTFKNDTIMVTITDEIAISYEEWASRRGQTLRGVILSQAMSILGNESEKKLLEHESFSEQEIEAEAMNALIFEYLSEHCRYNLAETLMRTNGGHRMPPGMAADVSAARSYAQNELSNNRRESLEIGRKSLKMDKSADLEYRTARSKRDGWEIEILGPMPSQIGMCRYEVQP
jgi:hypothetical protein